MDPAGLHVLVTLWLSIHLQFLLTETYSLSNSSRVYKKNLGYRHDSISSIKRYDKLYQMLF